MNTHLLALQLMAAQGCLGAFDTLYHHELTEALPTRTSARRELAIHSVRALIYGAWAAVLLAVFGVEIALTLWDFVVEDQTRLLPATERVTHGAGHERRRFRHPAGFEYARLADAAHRPELAAARRARAAVWRTRAQLPGHGRHRFHRPEAGARLAARRPARVAGKAERQMDTSRNTSYWNRLFMNG